MECVKASKEADAGQGLRSVLTEGRKAAVGTSKHHPSFNTQFACHVNIWHQDQPPAYPLLYSFKEFAPFFPERWHYPSYSHTGLDLQELIAAYFYTSKPLLIHAPVKKQEN